MIVVLLGVWGALGEGGIQKCSWLFVGLAFFVLTKRHIHL